MIDYMKEQIAKIKENALAEISNSKTLQELENVRVKYCKIQF